VDFVHLHNHSFFSFFDGVVSPIDLVLRATELGYRAIALTDHGNLCGAPLFLKAAREAGIKPILGLEVYLDDREWGCVKFPHLTLLAEDAQGFRNLCVLSTLSYGQGFRQKPLVKLEWLDAFKEGVICLSGCLFSPLSPSQVGGEGKEEKICENLELLLDIYGRDYLYLEVQNHNLPEQKKAWLALESLSARYGIPMVLTNDTHYLTQDQALLQKVVIAVGTKKRVEEVKAFPTSLFHLASPDEMWERVKADTDESVLRVSGEIADRIQDYGLDLFSARFPRFTPPDELKGMVNDDDPVAVLRALIKIRVKERFPHGVPKEIKERIQEELRVIERLGFSDYFLVVWDIVEWARRRGIPMGPGRGSVGGSYLAFLLGLTEIDPLRYGLLFSRFLHEGRKQLPDVDLDFSRRRRDEVYGYLREKYGEECVARIGAYDVIRDKLAVRDVARVLGHSFSFSSRLSNMLDSYDGSIDLLLEKVKVGEREISEEERKCFELARELVGIPRHNTIHAAGVVLNGSPLVDSCVPMMRSGGAGGDMATQYDMYLLEELGYLKIDLLGSRTVDVVEDVLQTVGRLYGEAEEEKARKHLSSGDCDDQQTWDLLAQGKTLGVFQLESAGMTSLISEAKPRSITELANLLALYRPGPLGSNLHHVYIDSSQHKVLPSFSSPLLRNILGDTKGVLIYQEQLLRIAQEIGGFSPEEADELRKAVGKKRPEIMARLREKWFEGAVPRVGEDMARRLWDQMEKFGGYGFNRSHAVAYALLTYRTAFLKAHYPNVYISCLLNSYEHNSQRLLACVKEARREGFVVSPPDINLSELGFIPHEDKGVLYGLSCIKGVGEKTVAPILREREKNGPFSDLRDFVKRCAPYLKRSVLFPLVCSGALDSLGIERGALLDKLDEVLAVARQIATSSRGGGYGGLVSLLGEEDEEKEKVLSQEEWWAQKGVIFGSGASPREQRRLETEYLGEPLSYLSRLRLKCGRGWGQGEAGSVMSPSAVTRNLVGMNVAVVGVWRLEKVFPDRHGHLMGFGILEDEIGTLPIVVFGGVYSEYSDVWQEEGAVLVVEGRVEIDDFMEEEGKEVKLIARHVEFGDEELIEGGTEAEREPLATLGGGINFLGIRGLRPAVAKVMETWVHRLVRGLSDGERFPPAAFLGVGKGVAQKVVSYLENSIRAMAEGREVVVFSLPHNVSVAVLRDLRASLSQAAFPGVLRVVCLEDPLIAPPVWHSFLKLFESPPRLTQFLLFLSSRNALPDTVLSRCLVFPCWGSECEGKEERGVDGREDVGEGRLEVIFGKGVVEAEEAGALLRQVQQGLSWVQSSDEDKWDRAREYFHGLLWGSLKDRAMSVERGEVVKGLKGEELLRWWEIRNETAYLSPNLAFGALISLLLDRGRSEGEGK